MTDSDFSTRLDALIDLGTEKLKELGKLGNALFEEMSPRDLFTLLFPPAFGLDLLEGTLLGTPPSNRQSDGPLPTPDEKLVSRVLDMARWWQHNYFTTDIRCVEKLPANGPAMIVGNHSGGLMPLDALFAMNAIHDIYGSEKRIYTLVHDFVYRTRRISRIAHRMGILRATKDTASNVLNDNHYLLVYPGGDNDAFRPFTQRNKIILAERKGFIRTALTTGAPIVPMVSVGLHESFLVLTTGESLAQKLNMKALLRTEVFPFSVCFPWGFVPAFIPFIPLPTHIEMEFCDPIEARGDPNDNQLVDDLYQQIEKTMQHTMDSLSKNRIPLLGRSTHERKKNDKPDSNL